MLTRLRSLAICCCLAFTLAQLVACMVNGEAPLAATKQEPTPAMRVYFAPGPDCERAACELINNAKETVHVRAYDYTSVAIRDALVAAQKRGVSVTSIVDGKALSGRKCIAADLVAAGTTVYSDANHRIAHQKTIVCDGKSVAFGSYNWSESAKHNAEVMVIRENDREFAAEFEANFEQHLKEPKTSRVK